jgi:LysM repeat protein
MQQLPAIVLPGEASVRTGRTDRCRRRSVEHTQPLDDAIGVASQPGSVAFFDGEGEAHLADETVDEEERDIGRKLGEAAVVDEQIPHRKVGLTVAFYHRVRVQVDLVGNGFERRRLVRSKLAAERANGEENKHGPVHAGILPRDARADSNWLHFPGAVSDNVTVEMPNKRLCPAVILLVMLSSAAVADEQVHVLARGETIYTLARRYDLEADVILEYNDIADPTRLAVGTRVRIPGTYVVREGEYVYSIARKLGVGWLDLLAANGLGRDDVVRPGDVLVVPGSPSPAAVASSNPSSTGSTGISGYPGNWPHPGERLVWDGKFPGVVMSGNEGDEFRSVTDGVVEFVGPFSSFGKLILVRSRNGFLYGYAGADRVLVTEGARVAAGSVIGTVGFSPAFDSAKVLFTVWKNNRYVDPETAPRG